MKKRYWLISCIIFAMLVIICPAVYARDLKFLGFEDTYNNEDCYVIQTVVKSSENSRTNYSKDAWQEYKPTGEKIYSYDVMGISFHKDYMSNYLDNDYFEVVNNNGLYSTDNNWNAVYYDKYDKYIGIVDTGSSNKEDIEKSLSDSLDDYMKDLYYGSPTKITNSSGVEFVKYPFGEQYFLGIRVKLSSDKRHIYMRYYIKKSVLDNPDVKKFLTKVVEINGKKYYQVMFSFITGRTGTPYQYNAYDFYKNVYGADAVDERQVVLKALEKEIQNIDSRITTTVGNMNAYYSNIAAKVIDGTYTSDDLSKIPDSSTREKISEYIEQLQDDLNLLQEKKDELQSKLNEVKNTESVNLDGISIPIKDNSAWAPFVKGVNFSGTYERGYSALNDFDNYLYIPVPQEKTFYINYMEKYGTIFSVLQIAPKGTEKPYYTSDPHMFKEKGKGSFISLSDAKIKNVSSNKKIYEQYDVPISQPKSIFKAVYMKPADVNSKVKKVDGKKADYEYIEYRIKVGDNASVTYDELENKIIRGEKDERNTSTFFKELEVGTTRPTLVSFIYKTSKKKVRIKVQHATKQGHVILPYANLPGNELGPNTKLVSDTPQARIYEIEIDPDKDPPILTAENLIDFMEGEEVKVALGEKCICLDDNGNNVDAYNKNYVYINEVYVEAKKDKKTIGKSFSADMTFEFSLKQWPYDEVTVMFLYNVDGGCELFCEDPPEVKKCESGDDIECYAKPPECNILSIVAAAESERFVPSSPLCEAIEKQEVCGEDVVTSTYVTTGQKLDVNLDIGQKYMYNSKYGIYQVVMISYSTTKLYKKYNTLEGYYANGTHEHTCREYVGNCNGFSPPKDNPTATCTPAFRDVPCGKGTTYAGGAWNTNDALVKKHTKAIGILDGLLGKTVPYLNEKVITLKKICTDCEETSFVGCHDSLQTKDAIYDAYEYAIAQVKVLGFKSFFIGEARIQGAPDNEFPEWKGNQFNNGGKLSGTGIVQNIQFGIPRKEIKDEVYSTLQNMYETTDSLVCAGGYITTYTNPYECREKATDWVPININSKVTNHLYYPKYTATLDNLGVGTGFSTKNVDPVYSNANGYHTYSSSIARLHYFNFKREYKEGSITDGKELKSYNQAYSTNSKYDVPAPYSEEDPYVYDENKLYTEEYMQVKKEFFSNRAGIDIMNPVNLKATSNDIQATKEIVLHTLGKTPVFQLQVGVPTTIKPTIDTHPEFLRLTLDEVKRFVGFYVFKFNFPITVPTTGGYNTDIEKIQVYYDQKTRETLVAVKCRADASFTFIPNGYASEHATLDNYYNTSRVDIKEDTIEFVAAPFNAPSGTDKNNTVDKLIGTYLLYNDWKIEKEISSVTVEKLTTTVVELSEHKKGRDIYFRISKADSCLEDSAEGVVNVPLDNPYQYISYDAAYFSKAIVHTSTNISRIFDFRVTDCTDVNYKNVFRKTTSDNVNEHTGVIYYGGIRLFDVFNNSFEKDSAGNIIKNDTKIPLGPYSQSYVEAPKLGYRISYDLKTSGYYIPGQKSQHRTIVIIPKLYYIGKDGNPNSFIWNVNAYYKNSSGKYVKIPQLSDIYDVNDKEVYIKAAKKSISGGGYSIVYKPNDGYRNVLNLGITPEARWFTKDNCDIDNSLIVLGEDKMCTNYDGFVQSWYGEYKLPNSTILIDPKDKYSGANLNNYLTDGYCGVVFYIGVVEERGSEGDEVVLGYHAPNKGASSTTNTSQWDVEGFIGFPESNIGSNLSSELRIPLAKGTWKINDQDTYEKIKGTVILYDLDNRAASDFE